MSELQIALLGFGALLVAAVWGYNLWQERKHRRHITGLLSRDQAVPDVLLRSSAAGREVPEGMGAVPREPTLQDGELAVSVAEDAASEPALSSIPPLPEEWADGHVDCLLRIEFVRVVPVSGIWSECAGWSHEIGKPLQWLGLDAGGGHWRALLPQDSGSITQLAVALQLVDRKGAVDAETLNAFLEGMHDLAQRLGGLVTLPEAAAVLERARKLDAFCASVDLQLDLLVVPHEANAQMLAGASLAAILEGSGLTPSGERFIASDAAGNELFTLTVRSAEGAAWVQGQRTVLVLSLDVPRVTDGAAAFDRMLACARQCAVVLRGKVTDAHGKPLAETTIAALRARIAEMQARMAALGIPAGSVRALRLFS